MVPFFEDTELLLRSVHLDVPVKGEVVERFDELALLVRGSFALVAVYVEAESSLGVMMPQMGAAKVNVLVEFGVVVSTTPELVDAFAENAALEEAAI